MKGRVILSIVFLTLPVLAAGCAGGDWPPLGAVQRPVEAVSPAAGGAQGAESAAPSPVDSQARANISALKARFQDQQATLAASLTVYEQALDGFLATAADNPLFSENWSAAQSALSRLSADIDDLRAINDDAAATAAALLAARAQNDLLMAAGEVVAGADMALTAWRQRLYGEQNRLAVLTPADVGAPGPNAVAAGDRTAFARIDFRTSAPVYDAKLREAVKALRAEIPGVAFDVIASGPSAATGAEQAALRQVLHTLRQAGAPYADVTLALVPDGEGVRVAIYLKKTSL